MLLPQQLVAPAPVVLSLEQQQEVKQLQVPPLPHDAQRLVSFAPLGNTRCAGSTRPRRATAGVAKPKLDPGVEAQKPQWRPGGTSGPPRGSKPAHAAAAAQPAARKGPDPVSDATSLLLSLQPQALWANAAGPGATGAAPLGMLAGAGIPPAMAPPAGVVFDRI